MFSQKWKVSVLNSFSFWSLCYLKSGTKWLVSDFPIVIVKQPSSVPSFSLDLTDLWPVLEHQFLSCLLLILFLLNYCYCCDRAQSILLKTLWALVKKIEHFPFLVKFKITLSEDRNCVRKTKSIARNNSIIVKWLCFPSERWSKMWKCHQVSWKRHFLKLQPELHFSQQNRQNERYSDSLCSEKLRFLKYLLVWGRNFGTAILCLN